ncbi:sulfofructose kinase [Citrobacter amalonaticus]|uniref:sugar kinase n=1 Tax=Citrobacter amalonaticus TaxID=35703 RepID=UPI0019082289|nr:sugar kinase [Citrobacter amalonaticus]ELK6625421.1 sugar kinase [Citrobacter amalonaticus]MBJ9259897.1 sugar kinase [Citrobacter amalonaticus]MCP1631230.1 sulfofructose kinase [Citrobacter amalonaticus]MCR9027963.1 sugar kinase [Citrobacter amalonaticus]
MTRIACVGITVQDRIYSLKELPDGGGKYQSNQYIETGGGPAATAAVAIARLGVDVDFIGRVGDDSCGNTLLNELQSWGVNTAFCRQYPNARSSQSAILVDQHGERIIVNYPSPDLDTDAQWLEAIDFTRYDIVLADVRWHEGTLKSFALARAAGVMTLLDADMTPQDITPLVALADHAVFSTPGLKRMTSQDNAEQGLIMAAQHTQGKVYVTLGNEGSLWLENEQLRQQPAFSVNVVDTTGAGDVFHGAMAVALAEKMPTIQAIRFASAVAAMKCTKAGGRAGIPNREQTESFLSVYA